MFCGHREMNKTNEIAAELKETCISLLHQGADAFFLGGYGTFDLLCKDILLQLRHDGYHFKMLLVIPYLNRTLSADGYDEIIYPPIEHVPLRYAISKRNEWMVMHADVVVSYVIHHWGGAYSTMMYARKKKKTIITLPKNGK